MVWYGIFFYITIFILISVFSFFYFKITLVHKLEKSAQTTYLVKLVLGVVNFLFLYSLVVLYSTFFNFEYLLFEKISDIFLCDYRIVQSLITPTLFATQLVYVYYFPFIYIFILITTLSILFCLSYSANEVTAFTFYCFVILSAGYALFFSDSIIFFFFSYEMLLVPSFFILYKFAKTRRCVEAAYLMFFWTQFGALFLIFSFIYIFFISGGSTFFSLNLFRFSQSEINFIFLCWIIGFGVKLPIWPFYGWLPKAHVESSTNFSIFLSGVLVKFAFFGLFKCLITIQLEPTFFYIYPFLIIGITDAVFKLFYQIDLKKLVAYSTVVEMHWLTICVLSGQSCLILSAFCMLISHALLSTNSFLLVDAINRRFKTRLITEISGVNFLCPKLFIAALLNSLIFLGFPGTIFFTAEFLFFTFFFDIFPSLSVFLVILLYLFGPTFFFRSWVNALFGLSTAIFKKIPVDLTAKETIIHFGLAFLMFWLGATWQSFIF